MAKEGLRRLIEKAAGNAIPDNSCEHIRYPRAFHTCPFKEEVNDDKVSLCGCCKSCEEECAEDV